MNKTSNHKEKDKDERVKGRPHMIVPMHKRA